jgi:hypothetical protein
MTFAWQAAKHLAARAARTEVADAVRASSSRATGAAARERDGPAPVSGNSGSEPFFGSGAR